MHKQSILYLVLVLLSTNLHAVKEIPPLQELIVQRIINEEDLNLAYVPQYFIDLGIVDISQFTPKVQQAFVNAIQKRFGQQLSNIASVCTLRGHTGSVMSIAISSDNKLIVTGSGDKTARVWDSATGQFISILIGHRYIVSAVAISSDNNFIVTGSNDTTAKVWSSATGQLIATLNGHTNSVISVAISPNNKFIVTGSLDDTEKVWDSVTGQLITTLDGHILPILPEAISNDNKFRVTGSDNDNTAEVWDRATGQIIATLNGHNNEITSVAISPDNSFIVTGSHDRTARIWDTRYCFNTIKTLPELLEYIEDNFRQQTISYNLCLIV